MRRARKRVDCLGKIGVGVELKNNTTIVDPRAGGHTVHKSRTVGNQASAWECPVLTCGKLVGGTFCPIAIVRGRKFENRTTAATAIPSSALRRRAEQVSVRIHKQ